VPADASGTELVGTALGRGEVVVIPTETVYGVAVLPDRPGAIDRLFSAKARPPSVAVAVLVADPEQAAQLAADPLPRRLVERHWPGPLTLVVRRHPDIEWELGGDPETIGIRCPDHELVRTLCRRLGPIATTSANRHGEPTPPTAAEVAEALAGGGVSLVLDGGVCEGEPSSVVDLTGEQPRVLREGAVSGEDLLA
jgi:L-threonylcarbamoyladenylate synthase